MESAGLKEWAIVCEAMGRGEQSVILRKGGIAEGRAGFAFRHSEFFLFPTFFHEQIDKVRVNGAEIPKAREGEIEIRFFAKVIAATHITSWETAAGLEPLHILQPSVVRERFDYDKAPGLFLGGGGDVGKQHNIRSLRPGFRLGLRNQASVRHRD